MRIAHDGADLAPGASGRGPRRLRRLPLPLAPTDRRGTSRLRRSARRVSRSACVTSPGSTVSRSWWTASRGRCAAWRSARSAPDAAYDCIANDRQGDCSPSQLPNGDWRQTNLSAFGNAYRSRRSLLWWEAVGARRDGHTNADHPDTGNGGDLDYLDQINFVPPLTAQELRDLATWIDLGMPYGEPAWDLDTARPVVHIEEPRPGEYEDVPRLLYGVADANSGIASIKVTASWSVGRRSAGRNLHDLAHIVGDGIYELDLDGGECRVAACAQELTVTAYDVDGNPRQVHRKFVRRKQGTATDSGAGAHGYARRDAGKGAVPPGGGVNADGLRSVTRVGGRG